MDKNTFGGTEAAEGLAKILDELNKKKLLQK